MNWNVSIVLAAARPWVDDARTLFNSDFCKWIVGPCFGGTTIYVVAVLVTKVLTLDGNQTQPSEMVTFKRLKKRLGLLTLFQGSVILATFIYSRMLHQTVDPKKPLPDSALPFLSRSFW